MRSSTDANQTPAPPVQADTVIPFRIRLTRPSLMDPWLASEPGLGRCVCMPNVAVLYLMNRPVAVIQATPMDQASLESTLARIRVRASRG